MTNERALGLHGARVRPDGGASNLVCHARDTPAPLDRTMGGSPQRCRDEARRTCYLGFVVRGAVCVSVFAFASAFAFHFRLHGCKTAKTARRTDLACRLAQATHSIGLPGERLPLLSSMGIWEAGPIQVAASNPSSAGGAIVVSPRPPAPVQLVCNWMRAILTSVSRQARALASDSQRVRAPV